MVDQRLVDYIKKELAAGYKPEAIRTYLINYGYNSVDVDEAIRSAMPAAVSVPGVAPPAARKIPIIPIIIGIFAVAIVIVLFLIIFAGREEEAVVTVVKAAKVDLKASMISSNVRQGDTVRFNVILTSLDKKSHDIGFIYEVRDSTGIRISQKDDLITVDQKVFEEKSIDIPEDVEVGRYTLSVIGRFEGEEVKSSISFGILGAGAEVKEEIVEFAEVQCPISCDDGNPCTDDQCSAATAYQCVHFPQIPCCGNLRCEEFEDFNNCPTDCAPLPPEGVVLELTLPEIIANVKSIASTNPAEAESYCNSLPDKNQKDSCLFQTAQTSKQSKYCAPVGSELKRDNCYSEFALAGDFSVCSKMTNVYMKESCFELEESSKTISLR